MILLKDIFNLLATGEFSNIALAVDGRGELQEKEYPKVVGHINLGLVELHKRFNLLQKELRLHLRPDVNKYYLREDKVGSLSNMGRRVYIQEPDEDDEDGFLNIVEVTGAYDSAGESIDLNNRHSTPFITQTAPDTLKITKVTAPMVIDVEYQAFPDKIVIDEGFDPADVELNITDNILEALLYYVAGRVYKPTGSNESTAGADKSASYDSKYELACQKLELLGLETQCNDDENTFEKEGWA